MNNNVGKWLPISTFPIRSKASRTFILVHMADGKKRWKICMRLKSDVAFILKACKFRGEKIPYTHWLTPKPPTQGATP